uniref:Uncharacterized protein n=1 Tax=Ditylenchus dipsaci TaxID=166011 RepID=A0A915D4F2_9BILA
MEGRKSKFRPVGSSRRSKVEISTSRIESKVESRNFDQSDRWKLKFAKPLEKLFNCLDELRGCGKEETSRANQIELHVKQRIKEEMLLSVQLCELDLGTDLSSELLFWTQRKRRSTQFRLS